MESIFLIIVVVLILLAISDLVVGVTNDAVNFLNGAIGSRAASLRIIMIVATAGIIAGATFSNGMMEVARKGLFYPSAFSFQDVMIIFLAVMLTDVILLDLFNTFGLPTSTTVSMVFELLGAAFGIAIVKIQQTTGDFTQLITYINSGKALAIISGILISVVIAFSFGAIIQWLTRLLFSFNFEKNIKYYGGLFGGFAITCIVYFILMKGLKDSIYAQHIVSYIPLGEWIDLLKQQDFDGFKSLIKTLQTSSSNAEMAAWGNSLATLDKSSYRTGIAGFAEWVGSTNQQKLDMPLYLLQWVNYYSWQILLFGFLGSAALLQFLYWLFRVNILKVVVLLGTFALAMAFAGNDLVNFIGVPLAGLASYQDFAANSGNSATEYLMSNLNQPVSSPTILILISGLIMAMTLWLSKKARSVIKTSLDLGDQDTVNERFNSNAMSRTIVRGSLRLGNNLGSFIPERIKKFVAKRFDSSVFTKKSKKEKGTSFDLVRGAVTLVVSSALIAFGTSLKLPLSTTYVTFMVAMGASLADGAWDRESAVYRVTGVITVIGGWFFTAISAFTITMFVALFIYYTWYWGIFILIGIAVFLLIRAHFVHKSRSKDEERSQKADQFTELENLYDKCKIIASTNLSIVVRTYVDFIDGLKNEKRKKLKESLTKSNNLNNDAKRLKKRIPIVFKNLSDEDFESGHYYAEVIDYFKESMTNLNNMVNAAYKHVDNNHKPLSALQIEALESVAPEIRAYVVKINKSIEDAEFKNYAQAIEECDAICERIFKIRSKQLKLIKKEQGSARTNILFLEMLNESKSFILNLNQMYKAFRDYSQQNNTLLDKAIRL